MKVFNVCCSQTQTVLNSSRCPFTLPDASNAADGP